MTGTHRNVAESMPCELSHVTALGMTLLTQRMCSLICGCEPV